MLWSIYVALAVASAAVITSTIFSIREAARRIKRAAETRTVLQKLQVQQQAEYLERVRALLDVEEAGAHERALAALVNSCHLSGYFPDDHDYHDLQGA